MIFNFSWCGAGWNSKCHGKMDLFRYLLMLMDQLYLINWNLQCLLLRGERANISYGWLHNLGNKKCSSFLLQVLWLTQTYFGLLEYLPLLNKNTFSAWLTNIKMAEHRLMQLEKKQVSRWQLLNTVHTQEDSKCSPITASSYTFI